MDKANPVSLLLSAAMLLAWIARRRGLNAYAPAAGAIEAAVATLVADPARRTGDLGGPLGTKAFTAAICEEIAKP
jgi:isocitrate/isopropylmalate dehydrogenase